MSRLLTKTCLVSSMYIILPTNSPTFWGVVLALKPIMTYLCVALQISTSHFEFLKHEDLGILSSNKVERDIIFLEGK